MEEEKIIKKQLLKNMLLTFITFTMIFTVFDLVIYNTVSNSLYNSIDSELSAAKKQVQISGNEPQIGINRNNDNKQITATTLPPEKMQEKRTYTNPRLIYIIRDSNGTITNQDNIGRFYDDYITDITFDRDHLDQIYLTSINNSYYYRGINFIINDENENTKYVQILVNVDGETQSLSNILQTLVATTIIMILVSIIISYILSKRTLKPIIESWNRQTEFVQNASHELRTPLTIIQAKQELLLQEPNKKIIDKSEDITVCLNETRRLSKLIKELMVLARADSNKLEINKEKTNIDDVIKEVSQPYIEMAKMQNKEVELNLNAPKGINIDRNKIAQLIIILLDNAIKYTGEKESVIISTNQKDEKTILEITDTGIGISKEGMKHIFERFYREDKARSRQTGGIGLGLAIAQTIVESHGGSIKLMQNNPKGTKVIVKL